MEFGRRGFFISDIGFPTGRNWNADDADDADLRGFFYYFLTAKFIFMLLHKELTDQISGAFYEVYKELVYGFLERVYQNALFIELKERGFNVVPQRRCAVHYKGQEVAEYFTDLIINDVVILELKAHKTIVEEHELQLQNYLKASSIEVGFVLNFGKSPEFSRVVFSNHQKNLKK